MSEWKPMLGRMSVFPFVGTPMLSGSALDVFRQVCGRDPDSFNKPANALGASTAQGLLGSLMVYCTCAANRVDINLASSQTGLSNDLALSLINDPSELFKELSRISPLLGNVLPVASRVASFVQFVLESDDIPSANAAVLSVMPPRYRPSITAEDDFILQINNRRRSESAKATMLNLITKWSVERMQVQTMLVSPDQGAHFAQAAAEHFVASVGFDHNNAPVPGVGLDREMQGSLLLECVQQVSPLQREYGLNVRGF